MGKGVPLPYPQPPWLDSGSKGPVSESGRVTWTCLSGIFPKRDFSTFSFTIISQQRNKVPEKVSKEVMDIATIQASYLMTVESVILNDETHIRVHRRFVAND